MFCPSPRLLHRTRSRPLIFGRRRAARKVPEARVASAFGTVPSEVLFGVFEARQRKSAEHPAVVYCGDNAEAKDVAAELLRDVGFDPVDAGPFGGQARSRHKTYLTRRLDWRIPDQGSDHPVRSTLAA